MFILSVILLGIVALLSGYYAVMLAFPGDLIAQMVCIAASTAAVGLVAWEIIYRGKK